MLIPTPSPFLPSSYPQENYLGQITVDLARSSNELNVATQRLNLVATVMLPLSVITGLFGMNVHIPGQVSDDDDSYNWFIGICAFFVAFSLFSYFFFKRLAVTGYG